VLCGLDDSGIQRQLGLKRILRSSARRLLGTGFLHRALSNYAAAANFSQRFSIETRMFQQNRLHFGVAFYLLDSSYQTLQRSFFYLTYLHAVPKKDSV
jgi:hypothetical protein